MLHHLKHIGLLAITLGIFCVPASSFATTKYWVGTGTGAMNVPGNWSIYSGSGSTTTVPGAQDVMVFNGGDTTNAKLTASMTGASIEIRGGYTGTLTMSSSTVLSLNRLSIGSSSAIVRLGASSRLLLRGSGTPLSGTGTLDASTNTPNTVQYNGQGTTYIGGTPASSLYSLTVAPPGFSRNSSILESPAHAYLCSVIDPVGGFAYFGTYGTAVVKKVRLSDFTIVSTLSLTSATNCFTADIDTTNGFAYFGTNDGPGKIHKVRLSDFAEVDTEILSTQSGAVRSLAVDPTNGHLYVGMGSFIAGFSTGSILKLQTSDLSSVATLRPGFGSTTNTGLLDSDNGFLYFIGDAGDIVKIRLSDFTKVAYLRTGYSTVINNGSIDMENGYLYFGTYESPAHIVRVRLSDFTIDNTITLASGENSIRASVIDTTHGFAYFACADDGTIVQVQLSDFTREDSFEPPAAENTFVTGVIDPTAGQAYFASFSFVAGYILKVNLGSDAMRMRGDTTVASTLTVGAGATLTLVGNTLTATNATITNAGTITQGTGAILHPSSSFSVTPTSLAIGSTLTATITDSDENTDGTAQDALSIRAGGESFTLTETTATSGIFSGTITTAHGSEINNNGIIENDDFCSFALAPTFQDPEDASDTATASSVIVTDSSVPCEINDGGGGNRGAIFRMPTTPVVPFTPAPQPSGSTSAFSDVPPSSWFATAVRDLVRHGIISGYKDAAGNLTGNFGPADPVTIGQILKIALLASGNMLPSSLPLPKNPTATDWSGPYVAFAESLHIDLASETSQRPATRAEVIHTLLQTFNISSSSTANPFTDLFGDHPYVRDILTATDLGLVTGDDLTPTVRPDAPINRAEIAVLVIRFMEMIGE